MGAILDSVKDQPDLCRADALQITETLVGLLKTIEETDPQLQAIQNTISMLAANLKEQFKPFLPGLLESLIKDINRDLDFKIVDAQEEELENAEDKEVQSIKLSIKGIEGAKTIQMNTNALENKLAALQILAQVGQALKEHFSEFVGQVAEQITPHIHDKISSSVRKNASKMIFVLIDCCPTKEARIELLKLLTPHLVTQIK